MVNRSSRVRAHHRRGRMAILWGCAVVALAQLTASILLDYVWPQIRFPQAGNMQARWQREKKTPEIVFFGSSRFQGIRCEIIDEDMARGVSPPPRSLNSSLPAGDPISAEWFLGKIFAQGHRPKLLVLEISPETVAHRCDWLEFQALRVLTWSDWPTYLPALVRSTHLTRVLSSRLVPIYRYRYEIRKQTRNAVLAWLGGGDSPPVTAGPARQASALTAAQGDLRPPIAPDWPKAPVCDAGALSYHRRALADYHVGGVACEALERLLERCRQEEIAVVLVGVPVSSIHRTAYTPEIDRAFTEYAERLSGAYGCRFVDLRQRVPDCCFADHHHVSYEGGEFVSRLLVWEAVLPAWRALQQSTSPKDERTVY